MEILWDILKIVLPAALVLLMAYIMISQFFKREKEQEQVVLRKESRKISLPLRLQAYERIVLYLERIDPNQLVMRYHKIGQNSRTLRSEMLTGIRQEFEHNMSQQMYVSSKSWELVKASKEEMIKLINIASGQVKDDASSLELSKEFLKMAAAQKMPNQIALEYIKAEVRKLF